MTRGCSCSGSAVFVVMGSDGGEGGQRGYFMIHFVVVIREGGGRMAGWGTWCTRDIFTLSQCEGGWVWGRGGGGESLTCDKGTKTRRMWWEMGQGGMMMLMMCFIQ